MNIFRELELGKILEGWYLVLWKAKSTLRFHRNEYIFWELELGKIFEGWNLALWRVNSTLLFHRNEYIFPRVRTRKNPWGMISRLVKIKLNTYISPKTNTYFWELDLWKILEGWNIVLWRAKWPLRFHWNEYIYPRVGTRKNPWGMKSSHVKSEFNTWISPKRIHFSENWNSEKSLRDEI